MTKEVKSKQSLNIVFSVWKSLKILSHSWSDLASSNTPFGIREWVPSGCLQTSSLPMPTKRSTQENLPYPRKQSAYNTAQVCRTTFGSRYTKHYQEKYNLHRIFMIGCGVLPLAYAVVHLGPANPDAVSFGAMCAAHEDFKAGPIPLDAGPVPTPSGREAAPQPDTERGSSTAKRPSSSTFGSRPFQLSRIGEWAIIETENNSHHSLRLFRSHPFTCWPQAMSKGCGVKINYGKMQVFFINTENTLYGFDSNEPFSFWKFISFNNFEFWLL